MYGSSHSCDDGYEGGTGSSIIWRGSVCPRFLVFLPSEGGPMGIAIMWSR